jgi:S1-C subfamily serine protease
MELITRSVLRMVLQNKEPWVFRAPRLLGILAGDALSEAAAKANKFPKGAGAILIAEVEQSSPAGAAGLKSGDWIVEFNRALIPVVDTRKALRRAIESVPSRTPIPIVVLRKGKVRTELTITFP